MNRPKVGADQKVSITVRFPLSLYRRLHEVSDERVIGVNALVVSALENFFADLHKATNEASESRVS